MKNPKALIRRTPVLMTLGSLLGGLLLTSSLGLCAEVTQAKAAELSLHRIERLVVLKKIESGFLYRLKSLRLEFLQHAAETDPAFRIVASQESGSDGSAKAVEIVLLGDGRPSAQNVLAGGLDAAVPTIWPDKDPVTLIENSLHFILENAATNSDLKPFLESLLTATLSAVGGAPGATPPQSAVVEFTSGESSQTLRVKIGNDGTFSSYELATQ